MEKTGATWYAFTNFPPAKFTLSLHIKTICHVGNEYKTGVSVQNGCDVSAEIQKPCAEASTFVFDYCVDKVRRCVYGSKLACAWTQLHSGGAKGSGKSGGDQERRKGIPWTEEEHRCASLAELSTEPALLSSHVMGRYVFLVQGRALPNGAGQVWQGRLAQHLQELCHHPHPHSGETRHNTPHSGETRHNTPHGGAARPPEAP
eukprot:1020446-Prorocentrum_minimum.AAC.5